jgi:iron complex outermembrane receptor protein
LDLSGRYDHYALNEGSSNHKFTYKAGVEYRLFDTLLFRGNYATVFRAPDLSTLFLSPSSGYGDVTDYYQCALAHSTTCAPNTVEVISLANPKLQPTVAQSWTMGTVWSPLDRLSLSIDYLRIAIQDEVVQQNLDALMRLDEECLLGQIDSTSAACQAITNPVNGQVQRLGSSGLAHGLGPVTSITTYYVNLASEMTESITASGKYQFVWPRLGKFDLELDYNDMLKHDYPPSPGALPGNSVGFKSILSGALSWSSPNAKWSSTLYGHRYGASPNDAAILNGLTYPGAGRVSPWITFNWSLTYRPVSNLSLSVLIKNVANKMPPQDPTATPYPYFNVDDYNVYGREIMLLMDLKFGNKMN